jgi:hypothetical protein
VTQYQNTSFQAKFEQGQLVVIDHSSNLPAIYDNKLLITYLYLLTHAHWFVKQMTFDGFILTVKMENRAQESERLPRYLIQMLAQSLASTDMSAYAFASRLKKDQQEMNDNFSESIRSKGWIELATSKPLIDLTGGFYIISIWMKQ